MTTIRDVLPGTTGSSPGGGTNEALRVEPKRTSLRRKLVVGALALLGASGILAFSLKPQVAPAAAPAGDHAHTEGGHVVLTEGHKARLGIVTAPVREASLTPTVNVVGTVTFDPEYVAAVGTRLRGLVRRVARFEGDVVKKGELLAEIDSAELGGAQASVLALRAQRRAAELNLKREDGLAARGLTTTREVEESSAMLEQRRSELLAAEQQVSALGGAVPAENSIGPVGVHQLRSPLQGTVVERHVSAGQSVESHLVAFRVANLDHLWVELAVFERSIGSIHRDDPVELKSLSNPLDVIKGRVAYVGEQVDPSTRTVSVRVEVDNTERKLRSGQAVTAKIQVSVPTKGGVVMVPSSAVTHVDGKPTVFVADGDLKFVVTPVELGASDGTDQQVVAGLTAGQLVVAGGVFALKSELFR
jgi:cobalt-zinc-cadmium efflux system membrane fusion protein